jgi:hypothetical protein
MTDKDQSLRDLQDIKNMMEHSSRFISLSGLSGIAAGLCAFAGGFFALRYLDGVGYFEAGRQMVTSRDTYEFFALSKGNMNLLNSDSFFKDLIKSPLFFIVAVTFVAAFASAFLFTWLKSKKQGIPVWGMASRRLMWNVVIPMVVGGIFLYKMAEWGNYGLLAPGSLIFYGLALLNASKYTLVEIRYLGFAQLALGILNCWAIGYGLYFWMLGFGVMHIVYGGWMWWKYERTSAE